MSNLPMLNFICFIRGGTSDPKKEKQARIYWQTWMAKLNQNNILLDNGILTTNGKIVANKDTSIRTFHFNLDENASGYIVIKAKDLDDAVALMQDCPVFMYDGNITIRPIVGKYSKL
jgi:hypothetical protein